MAYIHRWAEKEYELASSVFKAIIFSGPRQSGKTTLMKSVLPKSASFVTLDSDSDRSYADEAPLNFLRQYRKSGCLAIDEVQKVSKLFHEIKAVCDQNPETRQFLLSGSSNYKAMPSVHESMAGRLGEVRLRPMTEGEIQGNPPHFIERIVNEDFFETITFEDCNKKVILEKALKGGFPTTLRFSPAQRRYWFDQYVDAIIKRDLADLGRFRKPGTMLALLRCCAENSSRILNLSAIAGGLEERRALLMEYLAALEMMFLIERIPAWQPKVADRVGKTPKLLMCDSGLASYLMGMDDADALLKGAEKTKTDIVGNLIETWVYEQLAPMTDIGRDWDLFHFRSHNDKEIDFVLQDRRGDLICIEVKASEGVKSDHFKHLQWFRENYGKDRSVKNVVLYAGNQFRKYGDGEYAVPMAYLWL